MLSVSSGMYRERPDSKEGRISLQWLKFRLVIWSQDEGMSESCVENLEENLVPCLIWTGGSHPLTPREARGVQGFKSLQGLTLLEN